MLPECRLSAIAKKDMDKGRIVCAEVKDMDEDTCIVMPSKISKDLESCYKAVEDNCGIFSEVTLDSSSPCAQAADTCKELEIISSNQDILCELGKKTTLICESGLKRQEAIFVEANKLCKHAKAEAAKNSWWLILKKKIVDTYNYYMFGKFAKDDKGENGEPVFDSAEDSWWSILRKMVADIYKDDTALYLICATIALFIAILIVFWCYKYKTHRKLWKRVKSYMCSTASESRKAATGFLSEECQNKLTILCAASGYFLYFLMLDLLIGPPLYLVGSILYPRFMVVAVMLKGLFVPPKKSKRTPSL